MKIEKLPSGSYMSSLNIPEVDILKMRGLETDYVMTKNAINMTNSL